MRWKKPKRVFRSSQQQTTALVLPRVRLQKTDHRLESLVRLIERSRRRGQRLMKAFALVTGERIQQFLARGEVPVERAPRDSRRTTNIEDGDLHGSGLEHDLFRRCENPRDRCARTAILTLATLGRSCLASCEPFNLH